MNISIKVLLFGALSAALLGILFYFLLPLHDPDISSTQPLLPLSVSLEDIMDATFGAICGAKLFETAQLTSYRELVIFGLVFDVSSVPKFYGPDGGYNMLTGRDATRAYATGDLEKDLNDEIRDLTDKQLFEVFGYILFYFKKYRCVGFHHGRFFNEVARPTHDFMQHHQHFVDQIRSEEERFPPCIRTSVQGLVACSDPTQRPMIFQMHWGFPDRCACVSESLRGDNRLRTYINCDNNAGTCIESATSEV